jgi:hypothetical protein
MCDQSIFGIYSFSKNACKSTVIPCTVAGDLGK